VRAAFDWLDTTRDLAPERDALAVEFGAVAGEALLRASGATEAFERTLALRSRITAAIPDAVAAHYWFTLANLGGIAGRGESYDAAVRGAELYRGLGNDLRCFVCLNMQIAIGARRGLGASLGPAVASAEAMQAADWPPFLRLHFSWACYRWRQSQGRLEESLAGALEAAAIARAAGLLQYEQVIWGDSVADSELALGRTDAAEAHSRAALAVLESDPGAHQHAAHLIDVLAQVLAVQGKHEEAIATGQRALHRTKTEGFHFRLLEPMALSAAGQGRLRDAAWVTGHVDASYLRRGEVRWPAVAARRARLDALLAEGLDRETIAALRAEGARGEETVAFARAFGMADAEVGAAVGAAR